MLFKQSGALHLYVLAALLAVSVLVGLGVLVALDRAMLTRTAAQGKITGGNNAAAARANNPGRTMAFEFSPRSSDDPLINALEANGINKHNMSPARAQELLRNAPAKTIQGAAQAKTGKTVSVDKIEQVRRKALSSDGQKKINEAMKRRGEIDISKIREKLNR